MTESLINSGKPGCVTRRHGFLYQLPGVLRLALVSLVALGFATPILLLLLSSFKGGAEFSQVPPTYLPHHPTLDNYTALAVANMGRFVLNSLTATVIAVVLTVGVSVMAGYGFARFRFRGQGFLLVLVLATLMIPFQSIIPALYSVMDAVGLTNSLVGLGLLYTVFSLPFGVMAMRVAFAAIPDALEEAAIVDGLTPGSILVRVMVPLTVPSIATVALYAFFNSWNEFLAALIFTTKQRLFTLPVALANLQSGAMGTLNWGVLETGALVSAVPCIAIFLILQRYYVAGLVSGAVKE